MIRSAKVTAPLLASVALSMATGCRKPEMQRCVDEKNRVVDDSFCANLPANNQQNQNPNGSGGIPSSRCITITTVGGVGMASEPWWVAEAIPPPAAIVMQPVRE